MQLQKNITGLIACRSTIVDNSVWTGVGMWAHSINSDGCSTTRLSHKILTKVQINNILGIISEYRTIIFFKIKPIDHFKTCNHASKFKI